MSAAHPTGRPSARSLAALARRDPALGRALRRVPAFPGFPASSGPRSHYEALAHAICFQQLATRAAQTIWGRACALSPGRGFPRAEALLELGEDRLRGAGLSGNKVLALQDLARRSLDGSLRLRGVHRLPDEEVVARLVEVRGIGPWSAQMFLLFRLGRLDVMAPGDLGLQEGLRRLDGLRERPGPRELEARAEVWRPLRSVACWVLWRLLDEAGD